MKSSRDIPDQDHAWTSLMVLSRQARQAKSEAEMGFLLANETNSLVSYRQAAIWRRGQGIQVLSGLVIPDRNTPYAQWLDGVCRVFVDTTTPQAFSLDHLPLELAKSWSQWWPTHALWLPIGASTGPSGLVLVREEPWTQAQIALLTEWVSIWSHSLLALNARRRGGVWGRLRSTSVGADGMRKPWWRKPWPWLIASMTCLAAVPVRLTVLAPGELVPVNPVVIRAPMDGVIDVFHVSPNQDVRKGDPLFGFDEVIIKSRLAVARQALATSQAEYRQVQQQALYETKARALLAGLQGQIQQRRAEAGLLEEQLRRTRILAPQDGIVLFDDPGEWVGKPVSLGQRILRLAATKEVEIEAWIPIGDAIALSDGAPVRLFLNARPLAPVEGTLRYMAHEAVQRPDGHYAYRMRATLIMPTQSRVGLKGTARIEGDKVPALWWVLRRPVASLRTTLGL